MLEVAIVGNREAHWQIRDVCEQKASSIGRALVVVRDELVCLQLSLQYVGEMIMSITADDTVSSGTGLDDSGGWYYPAITLVLLATG
jgi:hypothetical protein